MNQMIFDIQMRSVRAAVEHLHMINLTELAACAVHFGTEADRSLIAGVAGCLAVLPRGHL